MGAALKLLQGGQMKTGNEGPKIPLEQHFREAIEWFSDTEDLREGREPIPRLLRRSDKGPSSDHVLNFARKKEERPVDTSNPIIAAILAYESGDKAPWAKVVADLKEIGISIFPIQRGAVDTVNGGTREIIAQINQVFKR